jgi:hypothetical protein
MQGREQRLRLGGPRLPHDQLTRRCLALGLALGLAACDDTLPAQAGAAGPSAQATSAASEAGSSGSALGPSSAAGAKARPQASDGAQGDDEPGAVGSAAPSGASDKPLELLEAKLTPRVTNDKEADGLLLAASPGDRAYLHVKLRNRTGATRKVTTRCSIGGEERTTVDLDVRESWGFRTWSYCTPRKPDVGKALTMELFEGDRLLVKREVPVERAARTTKGHTKERRPTR